MTASGGDENVPERLQEVMKMFWNLIATLLVQLCQLYSSNG